MQNILDDDRHFEERTIQWKNKKENNWNTLRIDMLPIINEYIMKEYSKIGFTAFRSIDDANSAIKLLKEFFPKYEWRIIFIDVNIKLRDQGYYESMGRIYTWKKE